MDRACSTHGKKMNAYRLLMGRQEEKKPWEELDVDGMIIL
jgi:hypothetical protein